MIAGDNDIIEGYVRYGMRKKRSRNEIIGEEHIVAINVDWGNEEMYKEEDNGQRSRSECIVSNIIVVLFPRCWSVCSGRSSSR